MRRVSRRFQLAIIHAGPSAWLGRATSRATLRGRAAVDIQQAFTATELRWQVGRPSRACTSAGLEFTGLRGSN